MNQTDIPYQDLTYRIIGAAMRIHRRTQRGLRELHYQQALTAPEYKRILPPKSMQGWQKHIAKYLWRPDSGNG